MVPKHLRKSNESPGSDQESVMASIIELQGRIKNDKSVLRQPVDTGVRGVRDLMKAVVGGTEELQEILLNECTIIYECKICRNLFRSLANFISHKRIYCIQSFTYFTGATTKQERELFQQSDVALEPEMVNCNKDVNLSETKVWLPNNKIVPNNIKTEKNHCIKPTRKCDIAKIADGLNQKARRENMKAGGSQGATFYSDIAERVMMRRSKQHKISPETGQLENNEYYQNSRESGNENQNNSAALEAIDRVAAGNEAVLQENGKFRVTPQGMQLENNSSNNLKCSLCETHFITQQMLSRHVQIHHKERICYPCPICRTFFPSPTSTYRHLSKDHHKTEQQIRRLRPKVLAKARKRKLVDGTQKAEPPPEPAPEPMRLNTFVDGVLRCPTCGKLFNRQAVLRVHLSSCKKVSKPVSPETKPSPNPKPVIPEAKPLPPPPRIVESSTCKPAPVKSGILVRRDYCKKFVCDVKSLSPRATVSVKASSLKRVNKWRTVLKKLHSRTGLDVSEKSEIKLDGK